MNVHPWYIVCIITRLSILLSIRLFYQNIFFKNIATTILLFIGLGFVYKAMTGSNNEVQLNKVFWHNTRFIHGFFYILSSYFLYKNNINMNSVLLATDLCFSILYRIIFNK